ncbi:MAG: DUF6263 family protein [Chthoniobacteraceae bacterium]
MKLPAFLLPLLALLFVATPRAHSEDAITLKQRFIVGKRYEFAMKMAQKSTFAVGGQNMEQTMNMAFKHSMTVSQHEDGKRKRVTVRYGRVAMEMNMGAQKMEFDSDKQDAATAKGPLAGMAVLVGKEFRLLLDEKDQFLDIENLDEITKAFSADPIAGKILAQFFTKDSMKELVQGSMLRAMPDHPVKPGDSWPVTYGTKMGQMGSVKVTGTYTYNKPVKYEGHACVLIGTTATLDLDMDLGKIAGEAAGGNAQAADMVKKMAMKLSDAVMTGSITFDPELGMARDTEITTKMKMSMTLPPGAQAPNGESRITVPIDQNISNTLLSVTDAK